MDMEEPIQYYPPDPSAKIEYSVVITSRNKDNLPEFMGVVPKKIPITFVADASLDYADRLRIFKEYKYSSSNNNLLQLLEGVTHNDILKL
jgi:hypothetical protein